MLLTFIRSLLLLFSCTGDIRVWTEVWESDQFPPLYPHQSQGNVCITPLQFTTHSHLFVTHTAKPAGALTFSSLFCFNWDSYCFFKFCFEQILSNELCFWCRVWNLWILMAWQTLMSNFIFYQEHVRWASLDPVWSNSIAIVVSSRNTTFHIHDLILYKSPLYTLYGQNIHGCPKTNPYVLVEHFLSKLRELI